MQQPYDRALRNLSGSRSSPLECIFPFLNKQIQRHITRRAGNYIATSRIEISRTPTPTQHPETPPSLARRVADKHHHRSNHQTTTTTTITMSGKVQSFREPPNELKSIKPFILRGNQLRAADPVITYYCDSPFPLKKLAQ